jgi:ethanolamine permease
VSPAIAPRRRRFGGTLPVVPRRSVDGPVLDGEIVTRPLGTWVAAGLSLAVIGLAAQSGQLAVSAAVLLAPVAYVFGRLHAHEPQAQSTSDLVGALLGARLGVFTGLIQLVAYVLLAVKFARLVGVSLSGTLGVVSARPSSGWVVLAAIAAVVTAGILLQTMSTRGISWVAATLAAAGILVYFYIALAVVTEIAVGNEPRDADIPDSVPPYTAYGLLVVLLIVGFEVVTTVNRDVRSVSRSMGLALLVTTGCAVAVGAALYHRLWSSVRVDFHDWQFDTLAVGYMGNTGIKLLLVGDLASACAGLLAITLGAAGVAHRLAERFSLAERDRVLVGGVMTIVGALVIIEFGWGGVATRLADVGPLLLLAVYVCAAHANARIPCSGLGVAAEAARMFMWVVAAAIVVVPLLETEFRATWAPRLGITAVILVAAGTLVAKSARLHPREDLRE